ncbi:MAG: FAD-dependent oxidoreductase [Limnohabitans sp.]|nr:FAD-dependent oxidoreductase [Limnohabitans sp.]
MKVAVIGAGVIGITTAYELAALGHEVSVFEKRGAAAEECSFANAGVASTGYAFPWAQPGMVKHVLTHLWKRDSPLRIANPSLKEWQWLWQWRKACGEKTFALNRERMLRLAMYSDQRRRSLSANLGLEHERQNGLMVLLRTESEKNRMQTTLQAMRDAGISYNPLNAEEARNIEPALKAETSLAQAIYFPDDEVSNCRQFTLLLKNKAEALGVQFHFNSPIAPLSRANPKTIRRTNSKQSEHFDAVVVSAGLASAALTKPLGLRIPLAAVHGYAISAPVREPLDAPRSGVVDERYKVAITRLGQRIRITGGSEIGGDASRHQPASLQTLYRVLDDWFPGAARTQENVQVWKGARPMLPDGPPLLGPSGISGVWLNLGHGASGWTLACGSARVIANQIAGQPSDIDLQGLGLERLSR